MKAWSALLLTATLALIGALSSCTADGGSIYAIIESEKKINVATLDEAIAVLDLVNIGSGTYPYLVAAGAVYKGTVPDANNEIGWPNVGGTPRPVSPPVDGALCTALTYYPVNTGLYGAFFTSDGSTVGLYKSAPGPSFSFAVAAGATAITDPLIAGKQITHLEVANGRLFVVAATFSGSTVTYELDYSADGTNFSPTNLTGLTTQITGVGFLLANNTYYVTSGPTLYSSTALGTLTGANVVGTFSVSSSAELRGVTVDNGYILIPSSAGTVYYSTDGTNWTRVETNDQLNGRSVGFLTVSAHTDSTGLGIIFLVGADGAGFYTLNVTNGNLERFSDVTVTGLYRGAVRRILVDPSPAQNYTVFMGTAGTGLWRANFDPATGEVSPSSTWIHE